jgi:mycothiol synthase
VADLSWFDELTSQQAAEVSALLKEAERVDGVAPVGEAVLMRMRPGATGSAHLLARAGGELVGYAHVDLLGDADGNKVAELAVHPAHRRKGLGAQVVTAVAERAEPLRIWAHGGHPGASAIAAKLGFRKVRELLRMGRELTEDLRGSPLPDGLRLRAFVPGRDEAAVVEVNRRAFSWHPEQGAMTVEDVRRKEREPWFDAAGFLLVVDGEDRLRGFHWTKVHSADLGEVYVVGVDPDAQGGGLGGALTVAGLEHLRDVGLRRVMLYVESDNVPAVRVYTRLGFTVWDSDVQYARQ